MHRSGKKMVVFDFDGTLVNSMSEFADIASEVMERHYNISREDARQKYYETSGLPFFQQLESLFPGNPKNAAASEEYEAIKKKTYFSRPVFTDAAETIRDLRSKNVKVVVSSNNFQNLVDEYIGRTNIKFDAVLGYRENFAKGEDHIRHLETKYGVKRGDIAFVGDSLKDGEKAEEMGVTFIAKEGTFRQKDFNRRFPDAKVVKTLSELKKII